MLMFIYFIEIDAGLELIEYQEQLPVQVLKVI